MAPHFVTCVQPTYSFSSLADTHTHTHMHRPHQTTNQTSGIWGLAVAWAPGQPGDTKEAATPECELPSPVCAADESGRGFKKKKKKALGAMGGWFLQINTSCPESCWREICDCLCLKRNQTREETSEMVQLKVTCKCICTWLKSWWGICQ